MEEHSSLMRLCEEGPTAALSLNAEWAVGSWLKPIRATAALTRSLQALSEMGLSTARTHGGDLKVVALSEHAAITQIFKLCSELMAKRCMSMLPQTVLFPGKWAGLCHKDEAVRHQVLGSIKSVLCVEEAACKSAIPYLLTKLARSSTQGAAVSEVNRQLKDAEYDLARIPASVLQQLNFMCGGLFSTLLCELWIRECRNKKEGTEQFHKKVKCARRYEAALESDLLNRFKRKSVDPVTTKRHRAPPNSWWQAQVLDFKQDFPNILNKRTWASFNPTSYQELVGDQALFDVLAKSGDWSACQQDWKSRLLRPGLVCVIANDKNVYYPCSQPFHPDAWLVLASAGSAALLWPLMSAQGSGPLQLASDE